MKNGMPKKIKVVDSQASVSAKALRVRQVRRMAHLTRRTISDKYHLNFNTFKGWEVERHGGLTLKGAKQLVSILKDNGVLCSASWLVYGIGTGPLKMNDQGIQEKKSLQDDPLMLAGKEDKNIVQELQFFRAHTPRNLSLIVPDDAVAPYYLKGEYVAGVKKNVKDLKALLGKICIIQTRTGRVLLRELQSGSKKGHFNLVATNPNIPTEESVMKDIAIVAVAPVIWVRRKCPLGTKAR